MDELEALKAVDAAFSKLDAGAKIRVFEWVRAKYGSSQPPNVAAAATKKAGLLDRGDKPTKAAKPTRKIKGLFKQVKDLDLFPAGKASAQGFADEKQPGSQKQKCVVATYYVATILELSPVTTSHIYTFFKAVGWPIPADLPNMLAQAGTAGWLDTQDLVDLKVTPIGENLVEHKLPKAKSK